MKKSIKKMISLLCMLAVLLTATLGGVTLAYAGTIEEECDLVFRKALEEILSEEDVTAPTVTVTKEPLYDLDLNQLGFVYLMHYDLKEGFALVVNTDGQFGVSEFYMEGANPYAEYEGQKIYVQQFVYFVFQDGLFTDTESGAVLDESVIESLRAKAFHAQYGTGNITTGTEVIEYTNRTQIKFELAKRHPCYEQTNLSNACTPAAGGNVIGYWTRYYPDLVPWLTPGAVQLGVYLYRESPVESIALVEALYTEMGTNVGGDGTSIPQFIAGMNSFVTGKGFNISYDSTVINGAFNYSLTKQKLESGLPLVLFLDRFRVDEFTQGTNNVLINYMESIVPHAMAGFGYNEITYTLTGGGTRTDTYIQVATGLGMRVKGYYNIYYNTQIDECYAITIY